MVRERYLSRKEYGNFLECYCGGVQPARADTGRVISDKPLRIEQRTLGLNCTCTVHSGASKGHPSGTRKRPFRVGHAVLVEGWRHR